ncbi:hypothetical protein [Kaarinaea lacus]
MDIKIIAGVLVLAIVALAVGIMIPGGGDRPMQTFPWQITHTADGTTQVFGLALGRSTLQQAEQVFQSESELSLFEPAPGKGQRVVEAYFDKVNLGGLSAKVVVVIALTTEELQTMFERGVRISTLGDGSRKVSLHAEDVARVRETPIRTITYLPRIRLESALLEKRFGKPERVIPEKETNTNHWLYPQLGLDIALDENNNAVFQYVAPAQFEQLIKPLDQR